MKYGRLQDSHFLTKALTLVGLMLVASVLMTVMLALWGWNVSIDGQNADYARLLRAVQALQSVCLFIVPSVVSVWLWSPEPRAWLRFRPGGRPEWGPARRLGLLWLLPPALMLTAQPGINLLGSLNGQLVLPPSLAGVEAWMKAQEQAAQAVLTAMLTADTSARAVAANLTVMALLPAVSEELLFRGAVQPLIERRAGRHAAVWGTAILFSAMHLQFYGFVPRLLIGALLGYAAVWTGSIWVPMMMHFVNNALVVTVSMTATATAEGSTPSTWLDTVGTGPTLPLGIISIVLTALLATVWARLTARPGTPDTPQEVRRA